MKVPRALSAAAVLLCAIAAGGNAPAQTGGAAQQVTTIAGTGASGMSDGPAAAATFLMPTGLARGADGTLYIADEAAQRDLRDDKRDGCAAQRGERGEGSVTRIVGSQLVCVLAGDLAGDAEPRAGRGAGVGRSGAPVAGDVVGEFGEQPRAHGRPHSPCRQLGFEIAQPAHASTASTALANCCHS